MITILFFLNAMDFALSEAAGATSAIRVTYVWC